jgi:8-oxo-dGTP diphosphatase
MGASHHTEPGVGHHGGMSAEILVVAAAIVRDGRVLAAQRSSPAHLAGGWEFPGGKLESGEQDAEALVRECREELGVEVQVGSRLGAARDDGLCMSLYAATVRHGTPRPLQDHSALRWVPLGELESLAWLPVDLKLLPVVRKHLQSGRPG